MLMPGWNNTVAVFLLSLLASRGFCSQDKTCLGDKAETQKKVFTLMSFMECASDDSAENCKNSSLASSIAIRQVGGETMASMMREGLKTMCKSPAPSPGGCSWLTEKTDEALTELLKVYQKSAQSEKAAQVKNLKEVISQARASLSKVYYDYGARMKAKNELDILEKYISDVDSNDVKKLADGSLKYEAIRTTPNTQTLLAISKKLNMARLADAVSTTHNLDVAVAESTQLLQNSKLRAATSSGASKTELLYKLKNFQGSNSTLAAELEDRLRNFTRWARMSSAPSELSALWKNAIKKGALGSLGGRVVGMGFSAARGAKNLLSISPAGLVFNAGTSILIEAATPSDVNDCGFKLPDYLSYDSKTCRVTPLTSTGMYSLLSTTKIDDLMTFLSGSDSDCQQLLDFYKQISPDHWSLTCGTDGLVTISDKSKTGTSVTATYRPDGTLLSTSDFRKSGKQGSEIIYDANEEPISYKYMKRYTEGLPLSEQFFSDSLRISKQGTTYVGQADDDAFSAYRFRNSLVDLKTSRLALTEGSHCCQRYESADPELCRKMGYIPVQKSSGPLTRPTSKSTH